MLRPSFHGHMDPGARVAFPQMFPGCLRLVRLQVHQLRGQRHGAVERPAAARGRQGRHRQPGLGPGLAAGDQALDASDGPQAQGMAGDADDAIDGDNDMIIWDNDMMIG